VKVWPGDLKINTQHTIIVMIMISAAGPPSLSQRRLSLLVSRVGRRRRSRIHSFSTILWRDPGRLRLRQGASLEHRPYKSKHPARLRLLLPPYLVPWLVKEHDVEGPVVAHPYTTTVCVCVFVCD